MLPIHYIDPVYRPPSEANSLILPLTDGCSWNRCAFCEMYTDPQKRFRARDEKEVEESLRQLGEMPESALIRRVFLADGDALALPTRRLLAALTNIRCYLPNVRRVSSYCLPRNLKKKSADEMREVAEAGLSLVYLGAESGDDTVLQKIDKGETYQSTVDALEKLGAARIQRSVMILNGLGGIRYSREHAYNSARLANATQPEYLAVLTLSFPRGEARFRAAFPEWEMPGIQGLFIEMRHFVESLELSRTVFRSDHASNWLSLRGTLGADKARLLAELERAIAAPDSAPLRPAWARGL
ncbi:MAG: radical SAM protein [Betaproteobacteria bacterium]|nr:radical SAM protein [Betaproteobacteria bacterium]